MTFDEIESTMFLYWESLPEPKKNYVQWWYSQGGIRDMLSDYHKLNPEYEDRFLLKPKLRMGGTNAQ